MKVCFLAIIFCLGIATIHASSHGEAPLDAAFPQTDATDLYAFRSYETNRSQYVTFLSNWNPRQLPYGGPNFYTWDPKFSYDIVIDNTGDGDESITFQFIFHNEYANNGNGITLNISGFEMPIALKAVGPITSKTSSNLGFLQYYRINVVTPAGSAPVTQTDNGVTFWQVPFDNAGNKTFPPPTDYASYANQFIFPITIPGCANSGGSRVFVGQRQESFSINLGKIFDLINFVPIEGGGTSNFPGGITQNTTNNVLRGTNIGTIALEVPISCVVGSGNGVIGVWTRAKALNTTGNGSQRQKSRMANALVNELTTGLVSKDRWNAVEPYDNPRLNHYILFPTFPAILNVLFLQPVNKILNLNPPLTRLNPSNFPRKDLIHVYLKGIQGLNQLLNFKTGPLQDLVRLNTSTPITPYASQNTLGVIGNDNAGYPNGRRPGDDVIDITLRVAMGVLCHVPLGYCHPGQAPTGTVQYTDGSPVFDTDFQNVFPYFNTPNPGSVDVPCSSISC